MRFMLTFRIPTQSGNQIIKGGHLAETLQRFLDDMKPEALYFADVEGGRGGYMVISMDDSSQIPALVEPFFHALNATVDLHPVFTAEDLQRGQQAMDQAVQKYG